VIDTESNSLGISILISLEVSGLEMAMVGHTGLLWDNVTSLRFICRPD